MSEILNELFDEINTQYKKIENSFENDGRVALFELTRCIDHAYVYVTCILKKSNKQLNSAREIFQFMSAGFASCLKLFYDNSTKQLGCPLYPSNKEMIEWANSCLINSGHIAFTLRFIELSRQGLFTITKESNSYKFQNLTSKPGLESKSVNDFFWWQSQNELSVAEESRLLELKTKVKKDLIKESQVWRDFFIKYGSTETLDEFYELLGKHESRSMVGYDSFPDEAIFNSLAFQDIKTIVEALIGYTLKHRDHCLTLLEKTRYSMNPWNLYTLPELLDDLANSIAIHKNLPKEKVLEVLDILSFNGANVDRLSKIQGGAPPLLIRISKTHILRSLAGCLVNPFSFLTEALKYNYEQDYFKAVNHREEIFKNELYNLFESPIIHKCETRITLKNSGVYITDIDALLYDEINGCLVIIQLKWYDNFGGSMKMRFSMSKNFYNSSMKWIRNITQWVEKKGGMELLKRVESIPVEKRNLKQTRIMVLGRNFSHFSDIQDTSGAIWTSWYTLQRAIKTHPEFKYNLLNLTRYLDDNSFEKGEFPTNQEDNLRVGKYSIKIAI